MIRLAQDRDWGVVSVAMNLRVRFGPVNIIPPLLSMLKDHMG
jgi:hypothetical protein